MNIPNSSIVTKGSPLTTAQRSRLPGECCTAAARPPKPLFGYRIQQSPVAQFDQSLRAQFKTHLSNNFSEKLYHGVQLSYSSPRVAARHVAPVNLRVQHHAYKCRFGKHQKTTHLQDLDEAARIQNLNSRNENKHAFLALLPWARAAQGLGRWIEEDHDLGGAKSVRFTLPISPGLETLWSYSSNRYQ